MYNMFSLTHMLSNTLKPGVLQHGGGLVRTAPCQKEGDRLGPSCLEPACSPCSYMASLLVLRLLSTFQSHASLVDW